MDKAKEFKVFKDTMASNYANQAASNKAEDLKRINKIPGGKIADKLVSLKQKIAKKIK